MPATRSTSIVGVGNPARYDLCLRERPSRRDQVIADVMGIVAIGGAVLALTMQGWPSLLGVALVVAGAATSLLVYRPWCRLWRRRLN
jgi:hypothetical protein